MVRRKSVVRPMSVHHFQRSSSPKPAEPVEAKFHVETQVDWGTKVCSRGLGHMTKTAAMPIYMVKTPQNSFSPEPKGQ